jgi:hypothetical protein
MNGKMIVTLRSAPPVSVEVPAVVKYDGTEREVKRSCFGALRLFPGLPKTVTEDELEHIKRKEPEVYARLEIRPYVESKRVDRRGASEADVERMAEAEGVAHLRPKARDARLRARGKLKRPEKRETAARLEGASTRTARRKPNGDKPPG